MTHPTIIDLGTEDDAGFWSEALSHCPDCDLWLTPAQSCLHIPARDSARATDRRGEDAPCFSPSVVLSPFHDERNATEAQQNPDAR